jgi:hypothetical protein
VVFDTNVLFSATGWRGRPYECLELARRGAITACTCQPIIDELAAKLRVKLAFSEGQVADVIADFLSFLQVVAVPGTLNVIAADPAWHLSRRRHPQPRRLSRRACCFAVALVCVSKQLPLLGHAAPGFAPALALFCALVV